LGANAQLSKQSRLRIAVFPSEGDAMRRCQFRLSGNASREDVPPPFSCAARCCDVGACDCVAFTVSADDECQLFASPSATLGQAVFTRV
jgi:hypothetical protein